MKNVKIVLFLLCISLVFSACPVEPATGDGEVNPSVDEAVDNPIKLFPVIAGANNSRVISIDEESQDENFAFTTFGPIVSGIESNSLNLKDGDTFDVPFLNSRADITVKVNADDSYSYEGVIRDSSGGFLITFKTNDSLFCPLLF